MFYIDLLFSFAGSLTSLVVSYGVAGGVGLGLMYLPAVVAVGQYFHARLNLATGTGDHVMLGDSDWAGISVCGSGAGTFLLAPLSSWLVAGWGWRGCNRLMAAACLACAGKYK